MSEVLFLLFSLPVHKAFSNIGSIFICPYIFHRRIDVIPFFAVYYSVHYFYLLSVFGFSIELIKVDFFLILGIRHAESIVSGLDAFGLLKYEAGVHRVQRIPSTEKSGRIHTSTVSVAIIPRPDDIGIV